MSQVHNTVWLQLESVVRFAEANGWEFNGRSFFIRSSKDSRPYMYLSFEKMQRSHNECKTDLGQIVEKSKLYYCKRGKYRGKSQWKTSNHLVKIV